MATKLNYISQLRSVFAEQSCRALQFEFWHDGSYSKHDVLEGTMVICVRNNIYSAKVAFLIGCGARRKIEFGFCKPAGLQI